MPLLLSLLTAQITRQSERADSTPVWREKYPIGGLRSNLNRLLKTLSESFDGAQDERRDFDIIDDFPFMLRPSKHSEPFSTTC
jgi:hypothetical protein